jgi:ferredoxin
MDETRHQRITDVLATLDRFLADDERPLVLIAHRDDIPDAFRSADGAWHLVPEGSVCHNAATLFDGLADTYAPVFAALRVARIELDGAWESPRHDALLHAFDWQSFSREELLAMPPVLAIESAAHLVETGLLELSQLLLSGRPLDLIVTIQAATNPSRSPTDDPLSGYRFELAYLGIGHREALVNQTSAARPDHLLRCFLKSLDATHTALHVVGSGLAADGRHPRLGSWLHGGAALEGRAHPFLHYDPEAGETWARRLDFDANPQPEADWPLYTLPCTNADGEETTLSLAFTFADFALLEPAYRDHFRLLPQHVDGDELVTVDTYLSLPVDDALHRIPFVWAADENGLLHRVVISRRLAFACRDRLGYWRTLQELAGVRNEYVREGVERERQRLEGEFADEREKLAAAHAAEIERVRSEAGGEAMQRLAQALLATDVSSFAADAVTAAPAAPPVAPVPEETGDQAEAAVAPVPEAVEIEEPWIDTALCTSCNDCLDINPLLFVYNANKQAVIGDPSAGTFEQLVKGAEKCPARCIHPGKPMNPSEPNLEELIERAKPFNV